MVHQFWREIAVLAAAARYLMGRGPLFFCQQVVSAREFCESEFLSASCFAEGVLLSKLSSTSFFSELCPSIFLLIEVCCFTIFGEFRSASFAERVRPRK